MKKQIFKLYTAEDIGIWIETNQLNILDIVKETYLDFNDGVANNPDSYFLRFHDSNKNRIIALPAYIDGEKSIAGLKWISSFPENIQIGYNRASAAVILNDRQTGYPIACMEGSQISAARTAASAVLGTNYIFHGKKVRTLGVIGLGVISFEIIRFLIKTGYEIGQILVHDLDETRAKSFCEKLENSLGLKASCQNLTKTIQLSELIIFATSSTIPYVKDTSLFSHNPAILHISLRDLDIDIIKNSYNFVDDIDHSLKANTSLHLTSISEGNNDFIVSGIADLINENINVNYDKPRIYSPFGMGVLDIAVAYRIYLECRASYQVLNFNLQ